MIPETKNPVICRIVAKCKWEPESAGLNLRRQTLKNRDWIVWTERNKSG